MNRLPIIFASTALVVFATGWWWIERVRTSLESGEVENPPTELLAAGTPAEGTSGTEREAESGTEVEAPEHSAPKDGTILIADPGAKTKARPKGDAGDKSKKDAGEIYTRGPKSFDGTGRYYMGREIAYVMGHQAIRWLERADREKEEAPSEAIAALNLKPTDVIADIGAGSGYYTFRLAPLVPKGKVIAVDIQQEMIDFLEKKEKKLGLTNVEAHLGAVDDTKLKPNSIDAALMVDAYHEFSHPREMMQSLVKALKPGGRIILLEYRARDPKVPIKPLHTMTVEQARKEMEAVGLKMKSVDSKLLPWQHFMVFVKR